MSVKFVDFNYSDSLENNMNIAKNTIYSECGEDTDTNNIQLYLETNAEPPVKKPRFQHKRKPNEVTYDDILNSLGFGFNNGVLHKKESFAPQQYYQPNYESQQQTATRPPFKGVDPRVKNSAIYNKYFKSYKDPNYVEPPKIPLTPEQLKIQLIKDYVERIKAKRRIAQIKPKKMLYSTQNIAISVPQYNSPNLNKLFSFSNR
jgi:hypothetical protein